MLYKQLGNKVNCSRKNCCKLCYEAKVKDLKYSAAANDQKSAELFKLMIKV